MKKDTPATMCINTSYNLQYDFMAPAEFVIGELTVVHPNGEEPKGSPLYSRKTLLQITFLPQEDPSVDVDECRHSNQPCSQVSCCDGCRWEGYASRWMGK